MDRKTTAIIVAAGVGKRMNSTVKKQYMEIGGYPVLYYTISAFEKSNVDRIVIVTGKDEIEYVENEIVAKHMFKKVDCVVAGGRERSDSVYEGLKNTDDGYVLIHDGVRMLVTPDLINKCIETVVADDACVAAVAVKDTIKECMCPEDENPSNPDSARQNKVYIAKTLDRSVLYQIQTPQCFKTELIKDAFNKMHEIPEGSRPVITDDAMPVELYTGHRITIVEGDYRNIKITTPEDLELARFWLEH
ncbi:MAG: 2-C-methyl-D-erythritol 4-phosphate cytidylyltransferase [Lachnospiraceae bacterium]|nr:2-C-methyl-D-erythritol 4-phosphate cytidylyltransferase [Lachnospiraceae bacterium]MCR5767996.1 2-C-methyl-D-erythritol 4-phosphate cytidylyltransferase [Lachnospiraceae bacterium]